MALLGTCAVLWGGLLLREYGVFGGASSSTADIAPTARAFLARGGILAAGLGNPITVRRGDNNSVASLRRDGRVGRWDRYPFDWEPGTDYQLAGMTLAAPVRAWARELSRVALPQLLALDADPDRRHEASMLSLSPDGRRAVVGTSRGRLLVLDVASGRRLWSTRLPEARAKQAAWSADSRVLMVGDQGARASVMAFAVPRRDDGRWGVRLWSLDVSGSLEPGAGPRASRPEEWYAQPGVYRMRMLDNGDVLVLGAHSWVESGKKRHRFRMWRLDSRTGAPRWTWPRRRAARGRCVWFDATPGGALTAFVISGEPGGDGETSAGIKPGSLVVLDAAGAILDAHRFTPVSQSLSAWRGVALRPAGDRVIVTLDDGRAFGFALDRGRLKQRWVRALTTAVDFGGVPVQATAGTVAGLEPGAIVVTGTSYIRASAGAGAPPGLHPRGLRVFLLDWDTGKSRWQRPLENVPQGLCVSADGRSLLISLSPVEGSLQADTGVHGAVAITLDARGEVDPRGTYLYRTAGPVAYDRLALSPDGMVAAVLEVKRALAPGTKSVGETRVHFFH